MSKKLKLWNGRGHGIKYDKGHIYVAAYSVKQAVELLIKAEQAYITANEINEYYNKGLWGNQMDGIIPDSPCVYASIDHRDKPKLILKLDK